MCKDSQFKKIKNKNKTLSTCCRLRHLEQQVLDVRISVMSIMILLKIMPLWLMRNGVYCKIFGEIAIIA
jgi:hypothetical protein